MIAYLGPVVLLPALLASILLLPAGRALAMRSLPYAALPALMAALLAPNQVNHYPALLFGSLLGLDGIGRVFLFFTAAIWGAVGFHIKSSGLDPADAVHRRFAFCFLLAMAGNFGVIVTLDGPGFYLFFAVLSLAAYGLIVTDEAASTRRAGRLYLILALFGEVLMLAAFLFIAAGREGMLLALLLYFGMGVKHGILPLHVWLPPAHGTAPAPASALLSGALLKAGVIGWLRFMPEAGPVLPELSLPIVLAGLAAAFLGAVAGVLQAKPKMVLAYSSISQMGIVTAGFGMALAQPMLWPLMLPLLALFAFHHALVKAALFLGVAARRDGPGGWLVQPALALLALALAAAPLTGGAAAKLWLDQMLGLLPPLSADVLAALLPATSVTTTVLMLRFLWLARQGPVSGEGVARPPAAALPFLLLAALALVGPWVLLWRLHPAPVELMLGVAPLWKTAWPILLGLLPALLAWRLRWRLRWQLPPGDVAVPLERWLPRLAAVLPRLPAEPQWQFPKLPAPWLRWERWLRRFSTTGVVYLLCLLVFAVAGGALAWL